MTTIHNKSAAAMTNAMSWLDERGVYYDYLSPHHLKIDAINFWPGRGTITIDGELRKRPEKGLAGLEAILKASGIIANSSGERGGAAFKPQLVR